VEEKPQQETTQIETTPEEEVPFTPEVPEETEKRWVKPLIFSILGLLVAAGLVFGGYKLAQIRQVQLQPTPTPVVVPTPTPEPTADWKIYTNTKYGYSIKYPSEWTVEAMVGIPVETFEEPVISGPPNADIQGQMFIEVRLKDERNTPKEAFEKERSLGGILETITEETTTFAGYDAYKTTVRYKQEGYKYGVVTKAIYLIKDDYLHKIFYSEWHRAKDIQSLDDWTIGATFDLMLSTFKFLEETKGWQTYMSSEYKLSFKYPTDFTIEENLVPTSNYLQVIVNKNKQDSFNIKASKDYLPADVTYFLDTPAIGQQTIGDNTWATYSLPEGYGLPEGTSPIYGLQLEKNGILYTLFFDQTEVTSTQNRILSTLKFID